MSTQRIKLIECEAEMDLSEWLLFIAIIDGPLLALIYMIVKRLYYEIEEV